MIAAAVNTRPRLILGSTSPYRRELLERLGLPFTTAKPMVDEAPQAGEGPAPLAQRLALEKAWAVAKQHPGQDVVVIGSDQVADCRGQILGKPGQHERAVAQLRAMRGQTVVFHTAVALVRPARDLVLQSLVEVRVRMGHYSDAAIEFYLTQERPYDCAGSAKSEGLGIALMDSLESEDPTALIGLPLIQTCAMLRQADLDPLSAADDPSSPA